MDHGLRQIDILRPGAIDGKICQAVFRGVAFRELQKEQYVDVPVEFDAGTLIFVDGTNGNPKPNICKYRAECKQKKNKNDEARAYDDVSLSGGPKPLYGLRASRVQALFGFDRTRDQAV